MKSGDAAACWWELAVATHSVTVHAPPSDEAKREREKEFEVDDADDEVDIQPATARTADSMLADGDSGILRHRQRARWRLTGSGAKICLRRKAVSHVGKRTVEWLPERRCSKRTQSREDC